MVMTPKEVRKRWVEALRSGEYQQGHGRLRRGDTYCCLGVLCDLHAKEHRQEWRLFGGHPDVYMYDSEQGKPSESIWHWAGLNAFIAGQLIRLNDDEEATFDEIADAIESHLFGDNE